MKTLPPEVPMLLHEMLLEPIKLKMIFNFFYQSFY